MFSLGKINPLNHWCKWEKREQMKIGNMRQNVIYFVHHLPKETFQSSVFFIYPKEAIIYLIMGKSINKTEKSEKIV